MFSIEGFKTELDDRLTRIEHKQLGTTYSFQAKPIFFKGPDRTLYEGWIIRIEAELPECIGDEELTIELGADTYTFRTLSILKLDQTYALIFAKDVLVNAQVKQ